MHIWKRNWKWKVKVNWKLWKQLWVKIRLFRLVDLLTSSSDARNEFEQQEGLSSLWRASVCGWGEKSPGSKLALFLLFMCCLWERTWHDAPRGTQRLGWNLLQWVLQTFICYHRLWSTPKFCSTTYSMQLLSSKSQKIFILYSHQKENRIIIIHHPQSHAQLISKNIREYSFFSSTSVSEAAEEEELLRMLTDIIVVDKRKARSNLSRPTFPMG